MGLLTRSRGSLWASGRNVRKASVMFAHARRTPLKCSEIQPNYLQAEIDQRVLLVRYEAGSSAISRGSTRALFRYRDLALRRIRSDDELIDFAREKGTTVYPMTGTARMGPPADTSAVVNAGLKVYGLESLLRVAVQRLDHALDAFRQHECVHVDDR